MDTLRSLPPEIVSKGGGPVRMALRKAAVVLQRQVKENLQVIIDTPNIGADRSTGLTSQNVVVSRGRYNPNAKGERVTVRVRNKKFPETLGRGNTTAANARRLEYGTEKRAPMPFIRPAFESKKQQALDTFVIEIKNRIAAVVRKLERQNKVKS